MLFKDVLIYNLSQCQIMSYQLVLVFLQIAKSFNVLQLKIHNALWVVVVVLIHFIIQCLVL